MEVFAVTGSKNEDAKIPLNFEFDGNITSIFLTKFNLKLQSYQFLNNLP